MRLLASVIEAPNGVSIRGGRPSQAGVPARRRPRWSIRPPASRRSCCPTMRSSRCRCCRIRTPSSSGGFRPASSSFRRGAPATRGACGSTTSIPTFRTHRGSPVEIIGLGREAPRAEFGGPVVKERLFLQQAMQFVYNAADVPSLPEDLLHTSTSFSSFTRVDANLTPRHSLIGDARTLSGQDPRRSAGHVHAARRDRRHARARRTRSRSPSARCGPTALFGETTSTSTTFRPTSCRRAPRRCSSCPTRRSATSSTSSIATPRPIRSSPRCRAHAADGAGRTSSRRVSTCSRNTYDGTSVNRPVLIERSNGTLARSLTFPVPTTQSAERTTSRSFAQDRFQPNARWYVEFGGRRRSRWRRQTAST